MNTYYVKKTCGCCSLTMQFEDDASAEKAFNKAGLGNSCTIVDDARVSHDNVDTFFGYALNEDEMSKRGFDYIVSTARREIKR